MNRHARGGDALLRYVPQDQRSVRHPSPLLSHPHIPFPSFFFFFFFCWLVCLIWLYTKRKANRTSALEQNITVAAVAVIAHDTGVCCRGEGEGAQARTISSIAGTASFFASSVIFTELPSPPPPLPFLHRRRSPPPLHQRCPPHRPPWWTLLHIARRRRLSWCWKRRRTRHHNSADM